MLAIAWFEFKTKLKRISTYVYFGIFTALAALWIAAAGGAFASANIIFSSDKVFVNSPYVISQTVSFLSLLGMVVIAAFMGRAVQQDFEYQAFHFFFTSPISKRDYVFGRFLGAVAILVFVFLGIALGLRIGTLVPGIDPARLGPWSLAAVARPYLLILLPNVLFLGAVFFGLAALTRRMLPVYVAGVVVLIGYLIGAPFLRDIDNKTIAALADPLGVTAQSVLTRYWSPLEKNTLLVPLSGEVLWNRALWLAIGAAIFAACYSRFRMAFAAPELRGRKARRAQAIGAAQAEAPSPTPVALPAVVPDLRAGAYLRTFPGLVALFFRETVKNVYFVAIVIAGALFIFANATTVGAIFGTKTYPVTYQVVDFASGSFGLFMIIITALYAGELVWRERDAQVALISDSAPSPTWLPFAAKLVTLFAVQAALQGVVMICGILVQLFNGYTKLELAQYIHRLFLLQLPTYWMLAALAITVHVLVNHKYLGHLIVVVLYVATLFAGAFGYDHNLYRFASEPTATYSDMNGYGHFLGPVRWFQLYWGAASVLLLVVARLFWVRGTDTAWRVRARIARASAGPSSIAIAVLASAIFVGTGAWIYYNTNILNPYRTEFAAEELRAQYERLYKPLEGKAQPKILGVRMAVDIYPHEHRIELKGTYDLKNKTAEAIPELYVLLLEAASIRKLSGSIPMKLVEERRDLNWLRYKLDTPLAPGATMTLDFDVVYPPPGFTNSGAPMTVVDNGTFVNSGLLPHLGYDDRGELIEDRDRKKHGLAPRPRMHDLDDAAWRSRNYISRDADWITFDATVSTDPDQIAMAPGYIQREWTENGRRYFHYKMDVPILNFFSFLSARYAVKKGMWHSPQGADVPIEIYYNPGHEYNVDTMIEATQASLDYYTKNFSPYQHHQVRILEFPRYASFAQSFPNTIPFSESIGFIAKVNPKDPKDIDYPYYVTAHEVAHQWWAHQVIGAYVQGATMMSETLAQYSALMVMKKKYGDAKMKRFLKYELDAYLVGRATERKTEQALYRNENQPYIHYRKGSIAMYALQDAIGEDNVNKALASYIRKVAYQDPPYTISRELLAEFRAVTPPEYQYLIGDLFETITMWDNRAVSATYTEKDGKYVVSLKVNAKKMRFDENGKQTEVPMDDLVDIGVFSADEDAAPLYLQKQRIKGGETTLTIEVNAKPAKAGIDPVNKLIDRRSDDNIVPVTSE